MGVDSLGYLYAFDVYLGRKGANGARTQDLGPSVVKKIASYYPTQPFIFVADNFFSSVDLAFHFEARKQYFIGTIRANRKYKFSISLKIKFINSN